MKVKEVIRDLILLNLKTRLENLEKLEAPAIIVETAKNNINEVESGNFKVDGLARKYKIADEAVTQLEQAHTVGSYYKYGKKNTVVLKITTASGTYYYDYFGNKIGKELELEVRVTGLKFETVKM